MRWRLLLLFCVCANNSSIQAAGLGLLTLHSSLGQHLDAEIEITGISAGDLETLDAYLASADVFEQMGIPMPSILQHIRFETRTTSVDDARIVITSVKPIREPFLNLVVELSWVHGTYLREYTFLLDPIVAHRTNKLDSTEPQLLADTESSIVIVPPDQTEDAEFIVMVQRGSSLLDIARNHTPDHLRVEQVAMAIYDRNPSAFFGSVHKLKRGAELVIPAFDAQKLRTVSSAREALGVDRVNTRVVKVLPPTGVASSTQGATAELADPLGLDEQTIVSDSANEHSSSPESDRSAVAAASRSLGVKRRVEKGTSVSALQRLIGDLRVAMVGLGKELQVKTTQLDDISARVDQLQLQQAVTVTSRIGTGVEMHGSVAAIKTVPPVLASSTTVQVPPDNMPPGDSLPSTVVNPLNSDASAAAKTSAANANGVTSAGKDDVPATVVVDSPASTIEPVSMLDINELDQVQRKKKTDITPDIQQPLVNEARIMDTKPVVTITTEAKPEKIGAFEWFFDEGQNRLVANRIRDAGLLSLAFILGFILVKRLFSGVRMVDIELQDGAVNADSIALDLTTPAAEVGSTSGVVNPLSAIEYFRDQLTSEQRREHTLRDALTENPDRQDIRLDLLRVYHERGSTEMFGQTARTMYNMTKGKNPEWHMVIEMGLSLDADMSFYDEPADHGFELNDDFAVSGTHITSVSGGKSIAQRPSGENPAARPNSVSSRVSNPQFRLDEEVDRRVSGRDEGQSERNQVSKMDFTAYLDHASDLDIDLDTDQVDDNSSIKIYPDNQPKEPLLDEAALDKVVWNKTNRSGLSDAELKNSATKNTASQQIKPNEAGDQNEMSALQKQDDLIEQSDSIPPSGSSLDETNNLDSVIEFDQQDVNDEIGTATESEFFLENFGESDSEAETESVESDDIYSTGAFSSESIPPVSDWKENEVKLDLAVIYIDMGNSEGALLLLDEVSNCGDATQVKVAQGLLSKLR